MLLYAGNGGCCSTQAIVDAAHTRGFNVAAQAMLAKLASGPASPITTFSTQAIVDAAHTRGYTVAAQAMLA